MKSDKIKAIIIDDEEHCIDTLSWQLNEYCPEVVILDQFNSPTKALKEISELNPDLIFLDVEMPEMNGFEFLEEQKEREFKVIFTTAYDKFAIKAFKVSALDYLVKPIDDEELQEAVKKVRNHSNNQNDQMIQHLLQQVSNQKLDDRVYLPTIDGLEFVNSSDIIRCESDSNYTTFYLQENKKIVVSKTLKEVEEMLDPSRFFRVHHSHIVNLDEVQKYVKGEGGHLKMKTDEIVPVSRSKKQELLTFLKQK